VSAGADERVAEVRARLEAIAEELADLSLEALGRAGDGDAGGLEDERRVSRARRAVVRAIAALDGGRAGMDLDSGEGGLA
jgi:hypothetical protein